MKWERLRGIRFGGMRDREIKPGPGLVVLEGENEAGKTMLLKLSTGLLFGYNRSKEERTRMICRGFASAEIEGDLRMEDGSLVTIRRTLEEKKDRGAVLRNGETSDIQDMPLTEVSGMTREFYRSVYALTQDEMGFPQKDTWKVIRSRIFEGHIADDLRPAQEVADELKKDTLAVWRPDRRGKPELDKLVQKKEELREALEQAEKRQEEIRGYRERDDALAAEYAGLEVKIRETETALEIERTVAEITKRRARIEQLREQAGDVSLYDMISKDPMEEYNALCQAEDEAARRFSDSEEALEAAGEAVAALTPEEEAILEKENKLRLLPGARENFSRSVLHRQSLAWDARSEHTNGDEVMREYLTEAVSWEKVEQIDPNAVKEAQYRVSLAEEAAEETERQPEKGNTAMLAAAGVMMAAAVLLFIMNRMGILRMVGLAAAGGACFTAVVCLVWGILKKNRAGREKERNVSEALQNLKKTRDEFENLLKELPLKPGVDPVAAVRHMKQIKAQCDSADAMVRQADERLESDQEVFEAADGVVPSSMDLSSAEAVELAIRRLEEALDIKRRAITARAELPKREKTTEMLRLALDDAVARRESFEARMYTLRGESIEACAAILANRRNCAASAETLEADMVRSIPDWENELERGRAYIEAAGIFSEEICTGFRTRQEEIVHDRGRIRETIRTLSGGETPAEVRGALMQVENEIDAMAKERDRKALALGLIRAAEKRYRRENQAELLKNAEEYLSVITDGRYTRIAFIEDRDGVSVYCREENRWIDPEHEDLSRGTVEQLYMALRLALIDRMDPEGETMPLFMDETLINWDARRMRGCIRLLGKVAEKRQVLLMTCHSWLPQALHEENIGFNHIRLVRSVRKIVGDEE